MQEEHTEHIDQLDNYYKEALENASVSPPADMWNRIATAMDDQQKPKGFWSSKKWLLALLALLFIASITVYFTLVNNKEVTNTEINTTPPTSTSTDTEKQEELTTIDKNQTTTKANASTTSTRKNTTSTTKENETPVANDNIFNEQPTSTTEIVTPNQPEEPEPAATPVIKKEAPKKKQSFREKHTEALKDSVRPLFVPTK